MKKNYFYVFVLLTFILVSCTKDEVIIDIRDSFISTYDVNETYSVSGTSYQRHYYIVVSKSSQTSDLILISNFAGYGINCVIKGEVSGNKLTIPQQTLEDKGFRGSGTLTGEVLSFSYQESSITSTFNVQVTATKL